MVAQQTGQQPQPVPSTSEAEALRIALTQALGVAFRNSVTVAIITGVIAFAGTLVAFAGTILNAGSQRRSIERQIAAQQEVQKQQLESAMENQRRQFEQELARRKEEEDRKTRSLVISVAIDSIVIAARTEVYADQVKEYTELTENNIERLRISIPPSLNPDWQHVYLFVTARALGRIRRLTTIVERANRRLNQLNSFRKQQAVVPAEQFKDHLNELAALYAVCSRAADETITQLKEEFSDLNTLIDEAARDLRQKRRQTVLRRPRAGTEDDDMVSTTTTIIRHPFDPDLEP